MFRSLTWYRGSPASLTIALLSQSKVLKFGKVQWFAPCNTVVLCSHQRCSWRWAPLLLLHWHVTCSTIYMPKYVPETLSINCTTSIRCWHPWWLRKCAEWWEKEHRFYNSARNGWLTTIISCKARNGLFVISSWDLVHLLWNKKVFNMTGSPYKN